MNEIGEKKKREPCFVYASAGIAILSQLVLLLMYISVKASVGLGVFVLSLLYPMLVLILTYSTTISLVRRESRVVYILLWFFIGSWLLIILIGCLVAIQIEQLIYPVQ